MKAEAHPWLKWSGCNLARKIELNNRLAEMQSRAICPPRFLDSEVVSRLSIGNQLSKLFMTRLEDRGGVFEIPIWLRALTVNEEVYREWCLEFYASLRVDKKFVDHEFYSKKLIHFRLGGKEHSVTIKEFGFLTGLLTEEESKDVRISSYLVKGKLTAKEFGAEKDEAWSELTGLPKHSTVSKVSSIRSPILRLVHKLLVYSFIHRLTQHDKCYLEDLWLLHTFHQRDPGNFVCVPWVLVCFMEAKGAGKVKDSQICCGHFVTKIVRNLGLFTQPNIKACTPPIDFKRITMHDLEVLKLLNESKTGLVEDSDDSDTEMRAQAAPARRAKKGKATVVEELQKLNRVMRRTERKVDCLSARYEYHMDRYRARLEMMAATQAADSGTSLPTYHPPPPFAPETSDETSQDEESYDSEAEEEEEE